eukprot:scaffold691_cov137-Isochrysis_galbana.AAC.1
MPRAAGRAIRVRAGPGTREPGHPGTWAPGTGWGGAGQSTRRGGTPVGGVPGAVVKAADGKKTNIQIPIPTLPSLVLTSRWSGRLAGRSEHHRER